MAPYYHHKRIILALTLKFKVLRNSQVFVLIVYYHCLKDYHEKLLFNPEIDLLSRLLLPLAGPEEFDTEDMDKLPVDLQYLPPDKKREEDADIRIMLMETIYMVR
jgi:hypothetical protein